MSQNRKKNLVSWHGQITTRHDNNKPETKKKAKWKKNSNWFIFVLVLLVISSNEFFFHHSFVRFVPFIHPSKTFSFLLPIFFHRKKTTLMFFFGNYKFKFKLDGYAWIYIAMVVVHLATPIWMAHKLSIFFAIRPTKMCGAGGGGSK